MNRDSLRHWTEDDNRWHSYVNYARHYLGREIAARVYSRIELPQTFTPEVTESVRRDRENPLHLVSKTKQPELAWTLEVTDVTGSPLTGEAGKLDERGGPHSLDRLAAIVRWNLHSIFRLPERAVPFLDRLHLG